MINIALEKKRLLLVEDDRSFGVVLKDYLVMNGYEVVHALDGEEGLKKYKRGHFDLLILDVMMPRKDGFSLANDIKIIDPEVPIIFLTAKLLRDDILRGYSVGADDYVVKPFDSEVLLYKIEIILKRKRKKIPQRDYSQEEFSIGKCKFNSKLRTLTVVGKKYKLSPKENDLLKLLFIYREELVTRDLALVRVWKEDSYFTARSMDVYIAKLRRYLKHDKSVKIENVHGMGFRLVPIKNEELAKKRLAKNKEK